MKFYITLFICLLTFINNAQVTNEGTPESWKYDLEEITPNSFPKVDTKALLAEDELNDSDNLPYRFGFEFFTNFNIHTSGKWDELPNGGMVWRMRFQSNDAITLNFLLEDFEIPQGSKIYLYNNDRTDLIGAYDFQQNNKEKTLSTWLIEGDDVWIEYYEPKKVAGLGKFTISKVVHGYRSQTAYKNDKNLNASGACNHDVDCPIGDLDEQKDHVKKSVGLIMINNSSWCSGALINTTDNDGTPYFLTANHCFSNPANWAFRFNWISPTPICGENQNSTNGAFLQTMSGSTLKARRQQTDFMLVEINNPIPSNWDVVYAGWDRSDAIPNRTFGVHHPAGDIMKVCRDDDAPAKLNQGGELVWRVLNWELGVTQPGSSGSALFDEEGRIVGQLWRGTANCSGTIDNNGWDEYGRFGISWDAGNLASNRLKDWLDPNNTGDLSVDQYPPLQVFSIDASISILNIDEVLCSTNIEPVLRISNQGENALTSATINYSINGATSTINWTGNLATGNFEDLQLEPITITSEQGIFEATISNPNNATDENLENTTSTHEYVLSPSFVTSSIELSLNLDSYPEETTWEFINSSGEILYNGGPYEQTQLITETFELPNDDCYTFIIYDEFGDGICCEFGQGSFQLNTNNGELIFQGGDFTDEEATTFNNYIVLSNDQFEFEQQINLYPNPANNFFYIDAGVDAELKYSIYDIHGKHIQFGRINHPQEKIEVSNFHKGIYLVRISKPDTKLSITKKLVVK